MTQAVQSAEPAVWDVRARVPGSPGRPDFPDQLFSEVIDLRFQSVELFLGRIVSGPRAGLEVIPAWAEIGRERRANAGRPPFCEPKLGGRAGTPNGPC